MLISEVADRSGVSKDTVRYYEKIGLIDCGKRRDNNYRDYPPETLLALRFISALKERGFTLSEIRSFFDIASSDAPRCGDVGPHIREKLARLDEQIATLQAMRDRLAESFTECSGNSADDVCTPVAEMEFTNC